MNRSALTRRTLLVAGLGSAFAPRLLAQGRRSLQIRGRTFRGDRGNDIGGAGGEGLRAASGMHIQNCRFFDLGNGAIRIADPVRGLIVEGCEASNMYRFLEDTVAEGVEDASLRDFVIRRVNASRLERGFSRLRYQSSRGLIEDVTAACKETGGSRYCVGFQLDDSAQDITYRRCVARGFREVTRSASSYWNGDGFSDERGNSRIRYLDCRASDCTDGGFDLKSTDVVMIGCVARGNKRNFRLWSSGVLQACESHEPIWRGGSGGKSHFSFHGDVGTYVLRNPVVSAPPGNTAPVLHFSTKVPAQVVIANARIDAPSAPLIKVEGGPQPVVRFVPDRAQQQIRTAS
jgi:hypothetical protein